MEILNVPESGVLPVARWMGTLSLGGEGIDCYVLDDGTRVISLTSAIRSTEGGAAGGNIAMVAGVAGLRRHLDFDAMVAGFVEFAIPGFALKNAKGMTTEWFERMLTAYVDAALDPDVTLTAKQRETARRCQVLQRGLIRTGLDALVDEATGYQKVREDDALQFKLNAFIAEELRGWEKTFPDALWQEFGRLSGWADPLKNRPQWWGKLVIWLIYDTLDADVAKYLKENRPPPNVRWHQQLTENVGVRALVSRCYEVVGLAKECDDLADLRDKVARHYSTKPFQLAFLNELRAKKTPKRPRQRQPKPTGDFQGLPASASTSVMPLLPGI